MKHKPKIHSRRDVNAGAGLSSAGASRVGLLSEPWAPWAGALGARSPVVLPGGSCFALPTSYSRNLRSVAVAISALCAISGARASEVSFTGGFTSFQGPVATAVGATAASVHTEINGVTVFADEALPGAQFGFDNYGLGLKNTTSLLDAGGNPILSVEFSRVFFSGTNPNMVAFSPVEPIDAQVGSVFKVGTFTVTNGAWFGNSTSENLFPDTDFGFSITTHSSDPALDGFTFSDTLRFVVTNPDDPSASIEADADYFYFVNSPDLNTISVLENTDLQGNPQGNTGSVDLMVKIGSLIPVAFNNPTGGAYIGDQVSAVPEPGQAPLLVLGLCATLAAVKRKRAQSA